MTEPERLPDPTASKARFLWNVVWKALLIFVAANLLFAAFPPRLGRVSAYNLLFPGRERLPFGENPEHAYNFTLNDLDALYASHEIAREKAAGEIRVVVLGDSSVWGTLLRPEETLPGQLEAALGESGCGRREFQVYNLGYPTLSLTKDLLILEEVLDRADPDLIVWPVTLESMPRFRQAQSPIVAANQERLHDLRQLTGLEIYVDEPPPSPFAATLAGRRRDLSDWVRLQLYGVLWAATGVDQYYPRTYEPAARDLEPDEAYYDWAGPDLPPDALALDALAAGVNMAGEAGVPVLLVNEPVLISGGENSSIRYNFYYPRWAYDQYRMILQGVADGLEWNYLDLWDRVPDDEFTNSAIHLTPAGVQAMTEAVAPSALALACPSAVPEETPEPEETEPAEGTPRPTAEGTEQILPTEEGGFEQPTPADGYPAQPTTGPGAGTPAGTQPTPTEEDLSDPIPELDETPQPGETDQSTDEPYF